MQKMTFTLSDDAIVQIAKLLQFGLMTGSDIIDELRLMRLQEDEQGRLSPTDEYMKTFNETIEKLLQAVIARQSAEG